MRFRWLMTLLLVPLPYLASAQEGAVSGGVESNTLRATGGGLYSNNYLKLDFLKGRFSAGVQAEYYPNPLPGYDASLKGWGLPGKYIAWTADTWGVMAGDFYDQFGTGILFRSWEDRNLGWNNSIGGGRFTFKTRDDVFSLKVLGGLPRQYPWYASRWLAGGEGELKLSNFSFVGSAMAIGPEGKPASLAWSAGASYVGGAFTSRAEWVSRLGGNAQTLELGYAARQFSSSLTLRRLDKMLDGLGLNYLPSLSMEQSYMLAALNPYTVFAAGELGGNADIYYRVKTWKFHVNGSMIYALPSALVNHDVLRLCYRDLNVQVEQRWNRRLKTVAFVSIQEQSPSHGERKATEAQNVFVLDVVYKTLGKLALRGQVQYLYSQELTRDWMAASLELSSTDGWSVHAQDMYNHGDTKKNYYEAGVSWTRSGFKADLSYGHQRAGMVCSGGVCRWQPEFEGALLRISYNF